MMPRVKRLSRESFTETLSESRRKTSIHFSVTFKKNKAHPNGCAAVVSKKVAKTSVARHLLKRRMLAVARPFCTESFSYIVYARALSPMLSFKALSEELSKLLTEVTKEV